MIKTRYSEKLGTGIYTIREAASYAQMDEATLRTWLYGVTEREPVITHQYSRRDKLVSFLDVVQAIGVHELRVHSNISLQKIRQAIVLAEKTYGVQYPFARNNFFATWGKEVFIKPNEEIGYVEASGKNRNQRCFRFVAMYLKKVEFDNSGLAAKFQIYGDNKHPIIMNPHIRFGEPMMRSGNSAAALMDAFKSEGSFGNAARAYGVHEREVQTAVQFYVDYIGKKAA